MYGTPPGIPGLVQTNITNSAEEKWALLDKDIEMEDSETENENRNGRTILHHTISLHYNATDARSPICAERSTFLVLFKRNISMMRKQFVELVHTTVLFLFPK